MAHDRNQARKQAKPLQWARKGVCVWPWIHAGEKDIFTILVLAAISETLDIESHPLPAIDPVNHLYPT